MALQFCSFASSSSGNCYLVKSENTTLLIDLGIAGKNVLAGLASKSLAPEDVDGILITHEHVDHVKSLRMIGKKAVNAKVFASAGTLDAVTDKLPEGRSIAVAADRPFLTGDILVKPFLLSHDATEPMGYSFEKNGKKLTIVTDTGYVTEDIFSQIAETDLLVLEANHEVNILKMGSYPYSLKRRILGDEGHLSNETAGKCICEMLKTREKEEPPTIVLAHLSKENNTPGQAYLTIRNVLYEEKFYIDKDIKLDIAKRDEITDFFEV